MAPPSSSTSRTELRWSVKYHSTRSLAFAARRSTRANVWSRATSVIVARAFHLARNSVETSRGWFHQAGLVAASACAFN
jgi:hypothetical protein